nr:immunoglobulin heavy chain junction region [Mus musculus]MBK4197824.1 immunoglobulin heavy chain junction region [Mus musculus]
CARRVTAQAPFDYW